MWRVFSVAGVLRNIVRTDNPVAAESRREHFGRSRQPKLFEICNVGSCESVEHKPLTIFALNIVEKRAELGAG